MYPDLTFGPLLNPEGGNIGPIATNPAIPHASDGFDIQWADLNYSSFSAGAYSDVVWITDDNNNNVTVWSSQVDNLGLGPFQTLANVVSVPPNAIVAGTYTIHVYINAWWVVGPSVFEGLNLLTNYTFYRNLSVLA